MVDLWVREEQCWTPGSPGRLLGGGPHRLSRRPGLALERRGMEVLLLFSHGGQRAKALQVGLSHTIVQPSERGAGGPNWEGASSIRLEDNNSKSTAADVYRELSQVSGPVLSLYIKDLF